VLYFVRGQDMTPATDDVEGWIKMGIGSSGDTNMDIVAGEAGAVTMHWSSDQGDDNDDKYRLVCDAGNWQIDSYSTGSYVTQLKLDGSATDVTVSAGDLLFATAGKGVCLGVTSNTDANTLDDYEEGTWTPVYTGNGGSIGSTAYDGRDGDYTKVGNIVYLSGYVDLSNNGDWSGTVLITGVPFNAANNGNQNLGGLIFENITIATTNYFSRVGPNEQYVTFSRNVNDSSVVYLVTTDVPDTGILRFSLIYTAA